jgi:hypothetical protein
VASLLEAHSLGLRLGVQVAVQSEAAAGAAHVGERGRGAGRCRKGRSWQLMVAAASVDCRGSTRKLASAYVDV